MVILAILHLPTKENDSFCGLTPTSYLNYKQTATTTLTPHLSRAIPQPPPTSKMSRRGDRWSGWAALEPVSSRGCRPPTGPRRSSPSVAPVGSCGSLLVGRPGRRRRVPTLWRAPGVAAVLPERPCTREPWPARQREETGGAGAMREGAETRGRSHECRGMATRRLENDPSAVVFPGGGGRPVGSELDPEPMRTNE